MYLDWFYVKERVFTSSTADMSGFGNLLLHDLTVAMPLPSTVRQHSNEDYLYLVIDASRLLVGDNQYYT